MQIHTLDKAAIISELQFGTGINHAVHEGRRADFALILSMFSDDVRDNTPIEKVDEIDTSEQALRKKFELQAPQQLRSDQSSYQVSATQTSLFHSSGLPSTKLSHYLTPDALTYLPEDTHNLPEEVYHNLSGHQRRAMGEKEPKELMPIDLYNQLIKAQRTFQIQTQA
ncbi:VC2046/SO_2500 family protein [Vibrio europaeus]|uniref:Queuosine biosynthesis protein QueD n=1 Tax=Vibrio europaeus TaxID=300876 RepID=A0A178JFS6_9VIBR|nr:VC2046/SO_2500 family protein [Vibrio europaeus]MDC5706809.1 VC2046/SO_2500 family protein [Vibrio europaeus]MDC5712174.1 VC2046/SO_2500 family protein [Vibrio europaeus]MDC5716817.1 VC2046/SO_2500 family protein [Vibrio europaeus]MDC5721649.1 VC2046/SO_2500 family protein [Vibrio europaeus]MDC5726116.1 VC2046/SO_2500 family protein [Vibrio europaeus]